MFARGDGGLGHWDRRAAEPDRDGGEQLGIDATCNAAESDPVEAMREFGGGDGVHAAIDTSGFTQARTAALEGLRPHGIFVEVGNRRGDRLQAERPAERAGDHADRVRGSSSCTSGRTCWTSCGVTSCR